jgi:hypothetical protein
MEAAGPPNRLATRNKLVGLFALCIVGQLVAAELMGFEFDEYPKLIILGVNLFLFLVGCLVPPRSDAHFYSAINIISIASIFVFYVKPMYILHQHTDSYPLVTHSALLYLTLFNLLFYTTYYWRSHRILARSPRSTERSEGETQILVVVLWIAWGLGMLALARNVLNQGGLESAFLTSDYRERTLANTEASFGEQVSDALGAAAFLAPVMLFDIYRRKGRKWLARILLIAVLVSIPATLLLTGSRRISLALMFSLGVILVRNPPRWARASALVLAFIAPFLLAYWTALRALPLADIDVEELVERRAQIVMVLFETPELSMFDEYCKVFNDVGDKLPVRYGVDYYKIFLVPIPRAVMPDKPLASGTKFLDYYYPDWFDSIGGAVTISTPGELLWNLSYFGIIGAILYAFMFAYVDQRWLRSDDPLKRSLYLLGGFSMAFGFVRGGHHLVLLEFLKLAWPALVAGVAIRVLSGGRQRSNGSLDSDARRSQPSPHT